MQTRSSFRALSLLTLNLGMLAALACSSSGAGAEPVHAPAPRAALPAATTPPAKLLVAYLGLQQALAKDDVAAARKSFGSIATAAQDAAAIADAAMRTHISELAGKGSASADLAAARETFGALSSSLLDWLRAQPNPLDASLHVAFCPMAFNGAGGKWLQVDGTVFNPYFGSQMLGCGSLDAEVKPGQKLVAK